MLADIIAVTKVVVCHYLFPILILYLIIGKQYKDHRYGL